MPGENPVRNKRGKQSRNRKEAGLFPERQNDFLRKVIEAEDTWGCAVSPKGFRLPENTPEPDINATKSTTSVCLIDVERLAGEILKLDRAVEGLATAGRLFIGEQLEKVQYIFEYMIKPQIIGSDEVYEMERMLRAMQTLCGLDENEWKRFLKERKQAIDLMRATTEIVVRRLIRNVVEGANLEVKK